MTTEDFAKSCQSFLDLMPKKSKSIKDGIRKLKSIDIDP